ncbi:hypothetical protein [Plantactinospora soyae]|uniref:Uncharacterized protein n=1 Tax=Plantactinospora soyae TaxID=1544732 RepID=A0A927M0D7_9ACTN|nr:hypothetical protein [Plantactinospora soyae]MBE1484376.1 hypothetical protein [Plantactinospora soyae]
MKSWDLTDEERRRGRSALVQSVTSLAFGVAGPPAAWLGQYLYDRRDLIFNRYGTPRRAFDAGGHALDLSRVGRPSATRPATLSLQTGLTNAVRQLGLREGDPVTLVLVGQLSVRSGSGLVVPALVGDQVELAIPMGTYSLTALASPRDTLFAEPDPFRAVTGRTVALGGHQTLALPLTARQPATWARSTTPSAPAALLTRCTCPECTRRRPVRTGQVRFRPTGPVCWSCGLTESSCDCLVGSIRRWWEG